MRKKLELITQIVPRASAVVPGATDAEPIAIHANYVDMVKFALRVDLGYKTVSGHMRIIAQSALDAVALRWAQESRVTAGT